MANIDFDTVTEKTVSNLIEYNFPEFFRTDGPMFIEFVKAYYRWLETQTLIATPVLHGSVTISPKSANVVGTDTEFTTVYVAGDGIAIYDEDGDYRNYTVSSVIDNTNLVLTTASDISGSGLGYGTLASKGNANYHIRRLYDYDDIDKTTDDFVLYFKQKYLQGIQFETQTKTRMLVKHALDIYRAKGTERALDLLFRIVFGVGATFYYPGDDVFKLSDGEWFVPRYIEVSLNNNTDKFINKQIVGLSSGATAFAESLIRRTIKGRFIDILYISAINGTFETNEIITATDGSVPPDQSPRMIGSLTTVEINDDGVSELYKVGDEVNISSNKGEQAIGRVTSVSDIVGLVNFSVANSGYAFTANANVFISEQVLVLSNVNAGDPVTYYDLFEGISQPLANIAYRQANNTWTVGANVYTYNANNVLQGQGSILAVTESNSTAGTLLCRYDSGNLNSTQLYSYANAMSANINAFLDVTATGNVIGFSSNSTITTSNLVGSFVRGEEIYQFNIVNGSNVKSTNATLNNYVFGIGSNGSMTLLNVHSSFVVGGTIVGATSGATATVQTVSLNLGYINGNNSFTSLPNNFIVGSVIGTNATVSAIGSGSGASFQLSNTLNFSEDVVLYTDILDPYLNMALNTGAYGLPANTSANLSSVIGNSLAQNTFTIGRPSKITNINKGALYNIPPFALVYEPKTFPFEHYGRLNIELDQNPFFIGELVTQESVNSRGGVVASNGNFITVDNFRFNANNIFIPTVNATTILVGDQSGGQANIISIQADTSDGTFGFMGANFDLTANTQTSVGAMTGVKIVDTGFGFHEGEQVVMQKEGLEPGAAVARLGSCGFSKGHYKEMGGFLSDQKKLFDGLYYQDFSYEVRSSLMLVKYEDMLKQLLHVAGTKYFGAFVNQSEIPATLNTETTLISSGS
jgi:hypothetical protein